ncbi:hypothetical protein AQUCO_00500052v1 [Aquilegia coerulea]|uniref:AAA+ ATPase domain-containing protein n=1 Tax=Aquilegia coerulea TaxID=218851 RepID=A0A2G5EQ51_AQUCA|nr:hypothetical protein AQUCO_00500052v1 [Aquilegia coerulea]
MDGERIYQELQHFHAISSTKVCFRDLVGCDELKQEILDIVHFFKNQKLYEELGAKMIKGALLVGPPGTGKKLFAEATAVESGISFLSVSASNFIGVGPSGMRSLFSQAQRSAPCILFIDEFNAIATDQNHRDALNQFLLEMDLLKSTTGVIIFAGTNMVERLEKILLMPGRFECQIKIDTPDIQGCSQFLQTKRKMIIDPQASNSFTALATGANNETVFSAVSNLSESFAALTTGANNETGFSEAALIGVEKKTDGHFGWIMSMGASVDKNMTECLGIRTGALEELAVIGPRRDRIPVFMTRLDGSTGGFSINLNSYCSKL